MPDPQYALYPEHDQPSRPRYFNGQFLGTADFIDEQRYHADRLRRSLRQLRIAGITDGLKVSVKDTYTVEVSPGTAIDASGRQLVLTAPVTYKLPNPGPAGLVLTLAYAEQDERLLGGKLGSKGIEDFTRIAETPSLGHLRDDELLPHGRVALAALAVSESGVITVTTPARVRQYSGLRLPGPNGRGPVLASGGDDDPDRLVLSGALSVSGDASLAGKLTARTLTVGRDNTQLVVADDGNAWLAGKLTAGALTIGKGNTQLVVTDNGNASLAGKLTTNTLTTGTLTVGKGNTQLVVADDGNAWLANKFTAGVLEARGTATLGNLTVGNVNTQFTVDATGSASFGNRTGQLLNLYTKQYGFGIQASTLYLRSASNFAFFTGGLHEDGELSPGKDGTGKDGTAAMVIKAGKVGIGTTNPTEMLEVAGTTSVKTVVVNNRADTPSDVKWELYNYGGYFYVRNSTSPNNLVHFGLKDVFVDGDFSTKTVDIISSGDSALRIRNPYDADAASTIGYQKDGNVFFLLRDTKANKIHGGRYLTRTGDWVSFSDSRLKHDINPIDDALDLALQLRPVRFMWNDTDIAGIGFIAQEVQPLLPELVSETTAHAPPGETRLGVSYDAFGPIAIAAIKQLHDRFERRIAELAAQVRELALAGRH